MESFEFLSFFMTARKSYAATGFELDFILITAHLYQLFYSTMSATNVPINQSEVLLGNLSTPAMAGTMETIIVQLSRELADHRVTINVQAVDEKGRFNCSVSFTCKNGEIKKCMAFVKRSHFLSTMSTREL